MKFLQEDKRTQLIAQGKRGEREKTDGKTRYEKRVKSRFSSATREYNQIDMNQLFKDNILTVLIPVRGETDDYFVKIKFGGFLDILRKRLEQQDNILNLRSVIRALLDAFNSDDVYIHCSCPDWKYRMAFWATVTDILSGDPENRPSKITNPKNTLGPGCKHVMLVLANTSWLIKVASVVHNYVKYFEKNKKQQYADILYPAIFGKEYEEPVQLSFDDSDELESDTQIIDDANKAGIERGRFQTGNQYRFQKSDKPDPNQQSIDDIENNIEDIDNG